MVLECAKNHTDHTNQSVHFKDVNNQSGDIFLVHPVDNMTCNLSTSCLKTRPLTFSTTHRRTLSVAFLWHPLLP